MTVIKTDKCLQVWQQVKAHGLLPHTLQTGAQSEATVTAGHLQYNGYGITQTLSLQSTRGGSRLNGRTNRETLVWKVHLLLLFLLGRLSRANCTTSPPSAPGTVHSLQERRVQPTWASRGQCPLSPDQASGPKMDQSWKSNWQLQRPRCLFYYCIMWETFPTPGKLEGEVFPAKSYLIDSWLTSNLVRFRSPTVVYIFPHLEGIVASVWFNKLSPRRLSYLPGT